MTYDDIIYQLEDLLHDRLSFMVGDEFDFLFEKDVQALQLVICYLKNKVNLEKVSKN